MTLTFFRQQPRTLGHVRNRPADGPYPVALETLFPRALSTEAIAEIRSWPGYAPTPLRVLDQLAGVLGVGEVLYKDESARFGLNSFRPLSDGYATMRLVADRLGLSVAATRGVYPRAQLQNQKVAAAGGADAGRAVAWAAQQLGCQCRIYLETSVPEAAANAVRALGAEVVRVDGEGVTAGARCARDADEHGWVKVPNVALAPREPASLYKLAGAATVAAEAREQAAGPITHVFVPASCGDMAAAVAARLWMDMGAGRADVTVVEPENAAYLLRSVRRSRGSPVAALQKAMMHEAANGNMPAVAWETLRRAAAHFVTIGENTVPSAIRMLASGKAGGGTISAGQCAASAAVALIAAACDARLRNVMRLDETSRVLLIGAEGAPIASS